MKDDKLLQKSKALNFLKILSAYIIVIFHYNKFTGTEHNDINFPFYNLLKPLYNKGGLLVELFFIISGFIFFSIYSQKIMKNKITAKEFAIKRVARLYPLYWITTLCILTIRFVCYYFYRVKLHGGGENSFTIIKIIFNILGIAGGWLGNTSYPYNGPAWFIGVIIICYILFYMLFHYINNNKARLIVIFSLIIVGFFLVQFNYQLPVVNHEVGRGVSCFLIGGLLYYFELYIIKFKKEAMINCTSVLILIISIILISKTNNELIIWYLLVLLLFPNIIMIILNIDIINKLFGTKKIEKISLISYSVFLDQVLVMEVLFLLSRILKSIDFYSKHFFITYVVLLTLFSVFTYNVVEKKGKEIILKIYKKKEGILK